LRHEPFSPSPPLSSSPLSPSPSRIVRAWPWSEICPLGAIAVAFCHRVSVGASNPRFAKAPPCKRSCNTRTQAVAALRLPRTALPAFCSTAATARSGRQSRSGGHRMPPELIRATWRISLQGSTFVRERSVREPGRTSGAIFALGVFPVQRLQFPGLPVSHCQRN